MAKKKTPAALSVALNRPISTQQQQILLLLSQRIAADARAYAHLKGWPPNTVRWPRVARSRPEAASVSRAMSRLEARGLIKRMVYVSRTRTEFIHITEAGMELIHRLTSCPS